MKFSIYLNRRVFVMDIPFVITVVCCPSFIIINKQTDKKQSFTNKQDKNDLTKIEKINTLKNIIIIK